MPERYCFPLPDARTMRAWDAAAIRFGLPEFLLMENAARTAMQAVHSILGNVRNKSIFLIAGGGNNGGDAACLARLLLDADARPILMITKPISRWKGAAKKHLLLARRAGVECIHITRTFSFSTYSIPALIVDGLLGTGFSGTLRPEALELVRNINKWRGVCPILALDVPSGLNADSGLPCPEAVHADATITFEASKPGLVLPQARSYTGKLIAKAIGIPRAVRNTIPPAMYAADAHCGSLLSRIFPCSYKSTYGHTLVIGGAYGMTGAAHLAARAAIRTGSGLVTAAVPLESCPEVRFGIADMMVRTLLRDTEALEEDFSRYNAIVIGPGIGRTDEIRDTVRALLAAPHRPPAVIDADALWHLAQFTDTNRYIRQNDILTPHAGEAARLLKTTAAAIQKDRIAAINSMKERFACICVLKGAGTLISAPQKGIFCIPFDVPNLAQGGSGDILAGCLGALAAGGMDSFSAAVAGTVLHAEAGLIVSEDFPERGNFALQTADALPEARARLTGHSPHSPHTILFAEQE